MNKVNWFYRAKISKKYKYMEIYILNPFEKREWFL
jgi:hypothetical protein